MDNRILTQLTPRAKSVLFPRHRSLNRQFQQTEATITALIAAAELLSAQDEITASGQLQRIADRLLLRQDSILAR